MCVNCDNGGEPLAAIWWRTSTDAQLEISPDTQINDARAMLEAEGYQVDQEMILGADWHSLAVLDCPKMGILLDHVRHGAIHAIGMYHSDRLAGKPSQKMFIIDLCERQNFRLLAKHSPIVERSEGELLEYIRTWAKEQQVLRAQQGSKDGLRDRVLLKGLPPCGRPPYGYDFPLADDGARDYTHLVPNRNWNGAKFIWQKALEGISMRQTIRELYKQGVSSPQGKEVWAVPVIAGILHNPAYAGKYHALRRTSVAPRQRRGDTYGNSSQVYKSPDEWVHLPAVKIEEPIVTWQEYLDTQARLAANKKFASRNAKHQYLLRGMIRCETHGRVHHGRPRENDWGFLYVCPVVGNAIIAGENCTRKTIWGPSWDKEVWNAAVSLLTNPDIILGEMERRQQAQLETEASVEAELEHLARRTQNSDNAEMELVSLKVRGDITDTVFHRQKKLLGAERTWLDEERMRLRQRLESVREQFLTIQQVNSLRQRIGGKLDNTDFEAKRFVLEALEANILIGTDDTSSLTFSVPHLATNFVSGTSVGRLPIPPTSPWWVP